MALTNKEAWAVMQKESELTNTKSLYKLAKNRISTKMHRGFGNDKAGGLVDVAGRVGDGANLASMAIGGVQAARRIPVKDIATSCATVLGGTGAVLTGPAFGASVAILGLAHQGYKTYKDKMETKHLKLAPYLHSYFSAKGQQPSQLDKDAYAVAWGIYTCDDFKARVDEDTRKFTKASEELKKYAILIDKATKASEDMLGQKWNIDGAERVSSRKRDIASKLWNDVADWEQQHLNSVCRRFSHHRTYSQVPFIIVDKILGNNNDGNFLSRSPSLKNEIDKLQGLWSTFSEAHYRYDTEYKKYFNNDDLIYGGQENRARGY